MAEGYVFNVRFDADLDDGEPTLFERREDADEYAALFADGEVEEVTVMGPGMAAGFISEAVADIEAEHGEETS
jgi:hypothetical protein